MGSAGFTILELLVAAAIGLIILGVTFSMTTQTNALQTRNRTTSTVDDALRGSLELISMNLREANGYRVLAAATAPTALASWVSGASALTVITIDPKSTFYVQAPAGYPASNYTAGIIQTPLNTSPLSGAATCSSVFQTGDYALATNGQAWAWLNVTTGCTSVLGVPALNHLPSLWGTTLNWNPNTVIGKAIITRYWVQGGNLMRQIYGSSAQVVAFGVSGLSAEYSANGTTWTGTPSASPQAVRFKLTAIKTIGTKSSTMTLSNTVFMRDLSTPSFGP